MVEGKIKRDEGETTLQMNALQTTQLNYSKKTFLQSFSFLIIQTNTSFTSRYLHC